MVKRSEREKRIEGGSARLVLALVAAALAAAALPANAQVAGAAAPGMAQYALIVNGDDSFTHNYNVGLALTALSHLGYAPQNTFVLAPAAPAGEIAGAAAPWRQPATDQGLRQALALLHQRLRPGDLLLVYLTGHGYRMFGRANLQLQRGSIGARELMQRLAELPFGRLILIADQCYSGGFVNAAMALGRNVVAASSADDQHEVRCEPWVRPLWLATMVPENDVDHNGFVSVEEASAVAAKGVRQSVAGSSGDAPQFATSGSCAGHQNAFSAAPLAQREAAYHAKSF